MPEFKSDTYTAQETAAVNAGKMIDTAELISGKSAFLQCKVTVPAGTAGSDTILAGFLPSGMTVVPGQSSITTEVTAGAGTFDIGVAGAADAIASNQVATAVGSAPVDSAVGSFFSESRQAIVLTLDGALTSGGVFYLNFELVNSN